MSPLSPAEQMRRTIRIIEGAEPLEEGPLRNLGMAGAVAAGLMGSPAHAQTAPPSAQYTTTEAQPTSAQWDAFMRAFVTIPAGQRDKIVAKIGTPQAYMQQAQGQKPAAESLNDWLRQAQQLSVDWQASPPRQTVNDFVHAADNLNHRLNTR